MEPSLTQILFEPRVRLLSTFVAHSWKGKMWKFGKLILRSWLVRVLSLSGIIGLVGLFFPRIPIPPWAPISVLILAVLIGCYDVYKHQQSEIEALKRTLEEKRSHLVILPHEGSKYYGCVADPSDGSWGTYLWFNLSVENKGNRNSTINHYDLENLKIGKQYPDIKPQALPRIKSREGAIVSFGKPQWLMSGEFVRVPAEGLTGPGILAFLVKDPVPEHAGPIHCRLTVTDTEGNNAFHDFELPPN